MLKGIKLNETLEKSFSGTRDFGIISNFSQINTFVGVNNSGKSRFLRTIFSKSKEVQFIYEISDHAILNITQNCEEIIRAYNSLINIGVTYRYPYTLDSHLTDIKNIDKDILNKVLDIHTYFMEVDESYFKIENIAYKNNLTGVINRTQNQIKRLGLLISEIGIDNDRLKKIYIPVLRGLRPISQNNDTFSNEDIYHSRTKHDYFKKEVPNGLIFTGLSIYEFVKKLLLGDEEERNEIKEFELFLEKNVFKKKITLIPKYDDDVLHIKIGNETQFPVYKLGDGLQTLIIILFAIFINRTTKHLIFIEEPETHLHPKWQRLLYRSMGMFENHTYFISTHSSVFINSKSNSIFIISKEMKKVNIHFSDIKTEKVAILKDLGYKPNDLYQTNYLLWVEGPSDKIYINYLIKQMDDTLVEGEDYSIMFYGGSSYKHFLMNQGDLELDFIESLNQNYGLIMDSDRKKSRERYNLKKKAIIDLFKKNKSFCWLTRLREIENYIPIDIFESAIKSVHKVKSLELDNSAFGDRCKYINLDAKPIYKSTIKLSENIFSKIQKNKDGSLRGISIAEIKNEIEQSIGKTKKSENSINKIKVAEKVVEKGFKIQNEEFLKKITEVVKDIKKANE